MIVIHLGFTDCSFRGEERERKKGGLIVLSDDQK